LDFPPEESRLNLKHNIYFILNGISNEITNFSRGFTNDHGCLGVGVPATASLDVSRDGIAWLLPIILKYRVLKEIHISRPKSYSHLQMYQIPKGI
jgi:hypothetical protein